jgi:hypothetical protein
MSDLICFRCALTLRPVAPLQAPGVVFECAGCGGAGYGAIRVPTLSWPERERCLAGRALPLAVHIE